jgi:hypothetical protein
MANEPQGNHLSAPEAWRRDRPGFGEEETLYGFKTIAASVMIVAGTTLALAIVPAPAGLLSFALAAVGYILRYAAVVGELRARIRRTRRGERGFKTRHEDGSLVIEIQRTPLRAALGFPFFMAMNTLIIDTLWIPVWLERVVRSQPVHADELLRGAVCIPGIGSMVLFAVICLFMLPSASRQTTLEVGSSGLTLRQRSLLRRRIRGVVAGDLGEIEPTPDGLPIRSRRGPPLRVPTGQPRSAHENLRELVLTALQADHGH